MFLLGDSTASALDDLSCVSVMAEADAQIGFGVGVATGCTFQGDTYNEITLAGGFSVGAG